MLSNSLLSDLFRIPEDNFFYGQVSSSFWEPMQNATFEAFCGEVLVGYQAFVRDEWSFDLPDLLKESGEKEGQVVIDLAGHRTAVPSDVFYYVCKTAAMFYSKHFNADFEPWLFSLKLDERYIKSVEKNRILS